MRPFCSFLALFLGLAATSSPFPVQAQSADASQKGNAPPAATLHPPELVQPAEAEYPPEAQTAGLTGRVVLRLLIGIDGRVSEVEVIEPAGHGFDEAASEAASRLVFTPARKGDQPIAARILHAYTFEPPAPDVTAPVPDVTAAPEPTAAAEATAAIPEPTAASASPPTAPSGQRTELVVRATTESERLRTSAAAVKVVETRRAQRQSADMGEVLARSEGVGVRRGGGLGSASRFSLNGLTDDQIRFFLDGIPLELAGYPFGIGNVPVNAVERVEIYRGVVPVRFGADALGGAVNLVTDDDVRGTHGAASYQAGSFGTQRFSLGARHLHEPNGFFARAGAFVDHADNDYPIDVEVPGEVPGEEGRLTPARTYRYHDAYRAVGANVETGLVEQPWADRLLLRTFVTDYEKELQHNAVMSVPYGAVEYGELSAGASARYAHELSSRVSVDFVAGYAYGRLRFLDVSDCVYDWFGQCINTRPQGGEIDAREHDQVQWEHSAFGRVNAGFELDPAHALHVSVAPTYTTRTGDERRQSDPSARDPLTAQRDLLAFVSGVEYEADLFDDRFENVVFVKDYFQLARTEEPRPGNIFRERDRDTHRIGAGNALRYRFLDWLYAKASYEWATRLPRPDEVFGDGVLVIANLELEPERSHNANLGATIDARDTQVGELRLDVNGFLREAEQLIVLLGNERFFSYQNVFGARSIGVEAAAGWTSHGDFVAIDGNVTYLDLRNTSSGGTFGDYEGDRIPNRPYLFANGSAQLQWRKLAAPNDEIALLWNTRYVHEFFRTWESIALRSSKQVIDAQLLHSLALTYVVRGRPLQLTFTGEVQNLTDAAAFDFFGVQRPGRAFYFKTTAQL